VLSHTGLMDVAEYKVLFNHLRIRPFAYGIPSGLTSAMVYLVACDETTDRRLFEGFSEWIKRRRGDSGFNTSAWFKEVIMLAIGKERGEETYYWDLEGDEALLAHQILFDSVDEFLSEHRDV
jgi:hypothetical protein